MKRIAASFLCFALASGLAQAEHSLNASELSLVGGLSVVAGSAVVIASPFILVGEVLDTSTTGNRVKVRVTSDQGRQDTIELPKDAVAKAHLQRGDRLTVKPSASGAVLAKNDIPIAFMVPPENAKLSHSHELAR
jgi:hypothetical protein